MKAQFNPLYADIWKVGVNLTLRISDLLSLKFDHLDLENRSLTVIEQKTGKHKTLRLNATVIAIIQKRLEQHPHDVWLFQVHSNRANNKPISRISVSRCLKKLAIDSD